MKKKIIGIAIVAIVTVGAAWNLNAGKSNATLSDITLDNVEALAACEAGYGGSCWLSYLASNSCCTGGEIGCAPCGH